MASDTLEPGVCFVGTIPLHETRPTSVCVHADYAANPSVQLLSSVRRCLATVIAHGGSPWVALPGGAYGAVWLHTVRAVPKCAAACMADESEGSSIELETWAGRQEVWVMSAVLGQPVCL